MLSARWSYDGGTGWCAACIAAAARPTLSRLGAVTGKASFPLPRCERIAALQCPDEATYMEICAEAQKAGLTYYAVVVVIVSIDL